MDKGEGEQQLLRMGRVAWALVGIALALAGAWWLVDQFGKVLVPLTLAMFPAAILTPPARWLEERGLGRTVSSAVVMAVALLAVVGALGLIVVQVQSQAGELVDQAQQGYERLRQQLTRGAFGLPPVDLDALTQQLREGMAAGGGGGEEGQGGSSILRAISSSTTLMAQLFFALVATFLYIRDGDRITAWVRQLFPSHWRPHVRTIGEDMGSTLGNYVRAQAVVAAIDAVFIGIGLVLLGVPLALSLTVLVFVSAFVPIVGAFLSGAAAALVALAAGGFTDALLVVAIVIVVQQVEGNVLQPWIMGNRVDLHPLAVITLLTLGAFLYGLPGAILAVPLSAAAYRALDHLVAMSRADHEVQPGEHPERHQEPDPDPDLDDVQVFDDGDDDERPDDGSRSAATVGGEREG